jgi:hypothetical protein
MAFLDFIRERNASQQQTVAPTPQQETPSIRSVESLPDKVKSQAVEAARPAAELMDKATTQRPASAQPSVPHGQGRGRSLGMER